MKKRLLAMLLALVMVMGTLPMSVFAAPGDAATATEAGTVATKDDVSVMLADHGQQTAPWKSASLTIDEVGTVTGGTDKLVKLTLAVDELKTFANGVGQQGKWIGIGVDGGELGTPDEGTWYGDGSAFYFGIGDYTASGYETKGYAWPDGYTAGGYLPNTTENGKRYVNQYWDIDSLKTQNTNKGFIVVKDPTVSGSSVTGWTYTVYDITFTVTNTYPVVKVDNVDATFTEANGVNVYTGSNNLSLAVSGTDEVAQNNKYQSGYFPKIDVKPGTADYVILSRGQNTNAFVDDALNTLMTDVETATEFPHTPAATSGPHTSETWFQVYKTTGGENKWDNDPANSVYWPNIANAPITNIVLATKVGDTYAYTKYKFDFSNCAIELPFTVAAATGEVLDKQIADIQNITVSNDPVKLGTKEIKVTGACKWVDSWSTAFPEAETHNYVALTITPTSAKNNDVEKIEVQMSDETWKVLDPEDHTLVWQLNATDTTKNKVNLRVFFSKTVNSQKYTGATIYYTLDLTGVTPAPAPAISTVYGNDVAEAMENSDLAAGSVLPYTITTEYTNLEADGHYFLTVSKGDTIVGSAKDGNDEKGSFSLLNTAQMELISDGFKPADLVGTCTVTLYKTSESVNGASKTVSVNGEGLPTKGSVTFTKIAETTVVVTAPVIEAPLADHPQGTDTAITGLGTVTVDMGGTYTQDAERKVITIPVTLTGTNIVKHHNAANTEGYWVGIGVPAGSIATFKQGWGTTVEGTNISADGTHEGYKTFYFNVASDSNTTGYVAVTSNEVTVVYQITFNVTKVVDDTDKIPAVSPAILNQSVDAVKNIEMAATPVTDDTTDVVTVKVATPADTKLPKHVRGDDSTKVGYWCGFALAAPDGAQKVNYYFGKEEYVAGTSKLTTLETLDANVTKDGKSGIAFYVDADPDKTADQALNVAVQWVYNDGTAGKVTVYKIDLTGVKTKVEEGDPYDAGEVKAANLTANELTEGPAFGHAAAYGVVYDKNTKAITITAKGLEKTTSSEGVAYWVGLALKNASDKTYTYAYGTGDCPETVDSSAYQGRDNVQDTDFDTIYWGWRDAANIAAKGWLSVKDADGKVVNYTVTFDVKASEAGGTAYTGTLVPANLTAGSEGSAPTFGHADGYDVQYNSTEKTITITVDQLEKTENSQGTTAYWAGVGVPKTPGATYLWYFNDSAPTADKVYRNVTREQTKGTKTYTTLYWGWEDAAELAHTSDGTLSVKDADGKVVDYTVKFVITPKTETANITVVEAPIADYPNAPDASLGAVTVGDLKAVAGATDTYTLTLTGTNIVAHNNANGAKGTWVGFGMPITADTTEANTTYSYTVAKGTGAASAVATIAGRIYEKDSAKYNTVYFDEAGVYTVVQSKNDEVVATYVVTVKITPKIEAVEANLTGWTAGNPSGGHADSYTAVLNETTKTITITATNLEKTVNSVGTEAYWVGVGLTKYDGAKYAWGYGDIADATLAYDDPTDHQTVDSKEYDTLYWGAPSATNASFWSNTTDGYVSVKTKDGTIINYTVTFAVAPAAPAAPAVVTNVETAILNGGDDSNHKGTSADQYSATISGQTITLTATGLKKTAWGNPGSDGTPVTGGTTYVVGVALPKQEDVKYAWGFGASVPEGAEYKTVSRYQGGGQYVTFYFMQDDQAAWTANAVGYISVKNAAGMTTNYTVNFAVTTEPEPVVEGTPYAKGEVQAANLTANELTEGPAFGHAAKYSVAYDPAVAAKTITITAEGLEMTTSDQGDDSVTAYWVGLALKQTTGNTYAYGFGSYDDATEKAKNDFAAADSTQNGDFDTIYWGFTTPEKIENNKTGWLSVKDAEGKVVTYVVNFEITVTVTVAVAPGEDGKIDIEDDVIMGLVDAAYAGKTNEDIVGDEDYTAKDPVATIVATGEDLDKAYVDVSVDTLTFANQYGVSVALDVEGVGTMTLNPTAISVALANCGDATVLTLEVANVSDDEDFTLKNDLPEGVDASEALATFTASVLKDGTPVKINLGVITLVFVMDTEGLAKDKIDVYQDGKKLEDSAIVSVGDGKLTLKVSNLSEFVIMPKAEKHEEPTPSYTPSIPANTTYTVANGSGSADGGSWSSNKSKASTGDTVTITVTPNEGYRVSSVTVKDAQGNDVEVTKTEDGKYTFTMPRSKVEVSVSFAAIIVFTDVDDDAYYADAVAWAVENGITNGMGDDKFAPNGGCTRAHIVTFLWRAMGSPEADTTVIKFTDVEAGSYYEKAVAWAVANGITNGTSADKFSPNELCTRAQAVTLLWRLEKMPAASGGVTFSDVRADAYYADAVAWAVANEITNGTGNNQFSPKMTCTRAQIVTFLYRDMA